jgi:uncharacterized SAM-binding protein YcdF (DUF218 family)
MFVIRQFVGTLIEPLILATLLGVLAVLARMFAFRRTCLALVMTAVTVVYLSSIAPVGDLLLGSLEGIHGPLPERGPTSQVQHIVVLGSGYRPVAGRPITGALDDDGLVRVVEGVRLLRSLRASNIVLSGGSRDGAPPAVGYAILARALGVDEASISILDQPTNTAEEARAVAAALGSTPFVLVTSAYHMPRAMRLMRQAGAQPIPAPTGQRVARSEEWSLDRWLPSSRALRNTERALHEYVGMLALKAGFE